MKISNNTIHYLIILNLHYLLSMIACVALIGKQNEPLYIRSFTEDAKDDNLKHQYHVHTSLDIIDEKIHATKKSYGGGNDLYLGLLFSVDCYKIYGYITNTRIKFIAVVKDTVDNDNNQSKPSIKYWLREMHHSYVDCVCNPFLSFNRMNLQNEKKFDESIQQHVKNFYNNTSM